MDHEECPCCRLGFLSFGDEDEEPSGVLNLPVATAVDDDSEDDNVAFARGLQLFLQFASEHSFRPYGNTAVDAQRTTTSTHSMGRIVAQPEVNAEPDDDNHASPTESRENQNNDGAADETAPVPPANVENHDDADSEVPVRIPQISSAASEPTNSSAPTNET